MTNFSKDFNKARQTNPNTYTVNRQIIQTGANRYTEKQGDKINDLAISDNIMTLCKQYIQATNLNKVLNKGVTGNEKQGQSGQ